MAPETETKPNTLQPETDQNQPEKGIQRKLIKILMQLQKHSLQLYLQYQIYLYI